MLFIQSYYIYYITLLLLLLLYMYIYIYIYIYILSCPTIYCKSLYKVFWESVPSPIAAKITYSKVNVLVHCDVVKTRYTDFSELVPSPVAVQVPGRNSQESIYSDFRTAQRWLSRIFAYPHAPFFHLCARICACDVPAYIYTYTLFSLSLSLSLSHTHTHTHTNTNTTNI
jgi:hypothetical protein